jgi:hypothetical protein
MSATFTTACNTAVDGHALVEQLRAAVAICEFQRHQLNARPLDPLAEAVHLAETIHRLADVLNGASPGLGMRLITALYVQVHAQPMPAGDYIADTEAAAAVH